MGHAGYLFQSQLFRWLPLRLFILLLNLIEIKTRLTFMRGRYAEVCGWVEKVGIGQGAKRLERLLRLTTQNILNMYQKKYLPIDNRLYLNS